MAPTIQNGSNEDKRIQRPQDRKSDMICRVKYCNTLPDIPFDLKFITYPFESDRFVQYNPTSLERSYRYEVLTEHDLGVTIDLVNRELYQVDPNAILDPADEKLLEEDTHTPQDTTRSRQHAKSVSWLRKSEYISTEQTRFQPQNMDKAEAKVGYNVKNSLRIESLYMDRDTQIKAIQKTFEDTKIPIQSHYFKPNVVAVETYSVFPDFKNWKYPCAQVIFDADPSPGGKNVSAQLEEMSQAMIRGVTDESGEQFVAYFLPTEETLEKRRVDLKNGILYEDDADYIYKMARQYNWNVKSKASKGYEENYFLVIREDGVYYNELETRVRLSKRRQKLGAQAINTKLIVKHRPLNADEHQMQKFREKQLEAHAEEEDEEEDEPEEEPAKKSPIVAQNTEEGKRSSRSRSKSGSRSSGSRSGSGSRSRSGSRSVSRSRSRSGSGSRKSSRSRSGSRASSNRKRSHSRSRSGSGSEAPKKRSRSRSVASHSRSRSASGSRKSTSRSKSRSRSKSSSRSGSHSGSDSRSGSDSD